MRLHRHAAARAVLPLAAIALLAGAPACGSLDASTSSSPPLATLTGQVVNPDSLPVTGGAVRVAVVWQAGSAGAFNVAEDLPVQPVFPSSFEIQLDDPPPASALIEGSDLFGPTDVMPTAPTGANGAAPTDPGAVPTAPTGPKGSSATGPDGHVKLQGGAGSSTDFAIAIGTVVAYLDKNGNGKLDLVPDDASGYVDQILATNQNELVFYLQGTIPSEAVDQLGNLPALGYSLHSGCDVMLPMSSSPGSTCAAPVDAGPPPAACYEQWVSITTPITLSVATDPMVNSLMCQTPGTAGGGDVSADSPVQQGRPATYPSACDPALECAADGSSYIYYDACVTVSEGICEGTLSMCSNVSYARPDPAPSDWPCKA